MLASNDGQNRFGEVVGPSLSFLKDVPDFNDFHFVCNFFYLLDPASVALSSLEGMGEDRALLEAVQLTVLVVLVPL